MVIRDELSKLFILPPLFLKIDLCDAGLRWCEFSFSGGPDVIWLPECTMTLGFLVGYVLCRKEEMVFPLPLEVCRQFLGY